MYVDEMIINTFLGNISTGRGGRNMRGDLVFSAPVRMLEPIICSIPVEELSHLETQEGPITDKDLIVLEEQTAACSVQDDTNQDKDFDRDTEPIAVTEETVATEVEFVAMEDVTVALDAPTKDNAASSEDGDFVMCPAGNLIHYVYLMFISASNLHNN